MRSTAIGARRSAGSGEKGDLFQVVLSPECTQLTSRHYHHHRRHRRRRRRRRRHHHHNIYSYSPLHATADRQHARACQNNSLLRNVSSGVSQFPLN